METGPFSESIRQKLNTPFSIVVTPGENQKIECLEASFESLVRCRHCQAYISTFCERNEKSWKCSICGNTNQEAGQVICPQHNQYQISLEDRVDIPITAIYLSMDYHQNDLDIIKPSVIHYLRESQGQNLLFFIGCSEEKFSILCPHVSLYTLEDGQIKYSPPDNINLDQFNEKPCPIVQVNPDQQKSLVSFIFNSSQTNSIIHTIGRLSKSKTRIPFEQNLSICQFLHDFFPSSPVHFVSIIPLLSQIPDSFKQQYSSLLCFDILTPYYSEFVIEASEVIPGRVMLFNDKNLLSVLRYVFLEKPIYQCFMRARVSNCDSSWKTIPYPFSLDERGILFSPVLVNSKQPFVLDLHPKGVSTELFVQVTAKMIKYDHQKGVFNPILIVFNQKISVSSTITEIVESINPKVLFWLWFTRTLDKSPRDVMAGLFRVSSSLVSVLNRDNKLYESLIRCCCCMKFYAFNSDNDINRFIGRSLLCFVSPHHLSVLPEKDEECNCYITMSGIYSDSPNEKTFKKAEEIGFFNGVFSPIPDWVKVNDPQSLEFFESLLPDYEEDE